MTLRGAQLSPALRVDEDRPGGARRRIRGVSLADSVGVALGDSVQIRRLTMPRVPPADTRLRIAFYFSEVRRAYDLRSVGQVRHLHC
jgi:hypothetical protein